MATAQSPWRRSHRFPQFERREIRRLRRALLAAAMLLLVSSCKKTASSSQPPLPLKTVAVPAAPAQAWDDDTAWIEGLRRRAGDEAVFLVRTSTGTILGRTPSGRIARELVTSDADLPLLDGKLELLWLREDRKLYVVDLREKKPSRILIGRGLPEPAAFWISGTVRDEPIDVSRPPACAMDLGIVLNWVKKPTLRIFREYKPDGEETKEDWKLRLVGQDWLTSNLNREGGSHPRFLDLWKDGEKSTADLPPAVANKGDAPGDRSKMIAFGQKGWNLVIAGGHREGDCYRYNCLIFDPARKWFASPLDPLKWGKPESVAPARCGIFYFNASGSHYLGQGKVCGLVGGCVDIAGEGLGWLPTSAWILIGGG
jgi:hypothetical protein